MKKFFVATLCYLVLSGAFSSVQSQEKYFPIVANSKDLQAPEISFGFRYGRMGLLKPEPPPGSSRSLRSSYYKIPNYLGFANISLAMHVPCLVSNNKTIHGVLLASNLSILRSTTMLGYVFSRPVWYVSFSLGYEVLRDREGDFSFAKTEFSKNLAVYQFECGMQTSFKNSPWFVRSRASLEYSLDGYGFFPQVDMSLGRSQCLYPNLSVSLGAFMDGLWGLGPVLAVELHSTTRLYVQRFYHHFQFQDRRFPEQRMGMTQGFAVGLLTRFR